MIALKQVLVPTDFSETSEVALKYGASLAETFSSSLHVLHVIPDPYSQPWSVEATGVSIADLLRTWEEDAKKRLDALMPAAERAKAKAELATCVGHPFVEIIRYARDHQIDLIVMGTHGRGPVGHMFLGSVAEKVVRKAPCPVLTVRHPQHEFVRP
jgi:nucleotide-binding universal stress UspA family protein